MRLLHVETLELREFYDDQTPPYAILSHTWGDDAEELSLHDILAGEPFKDGIGIKKLRGSCAQARAEGLNYVWIDTCCIDKTNLVELSEAINSMYRWYQHARVCYAFLWDVEAGENPRDDSSGFMKSRWFRRGWTLQELLAPQRAVFYSSDWTRLGTKVQLSTVIEQVTGIPHSFLRGISDIRSASVAQRMSWASKRETKRKEDMAYSLLGIFGITMPMIYGEGGEQAFIRLQEQIMRTTRDQSILAWGIIPVPSATDAPSRPSQSLGFLASSPSEFAASGDVVTNDPGSSYLDLLEIRGGDLRASVSLLGSGENDLFALLNCRPQRELNQYVVGIPLRRVTGPQGLADQYLRPRGSHAGYRSTFKLAAIGERSTIHIRSDGAHHRPGGAEQQQYGWVYHDDDFDKLGLTIVEVLPRSAWDKDRALIMSNSIEPPPPSGSSVGPKGRLLAQFMGDKTGSTTVPLHPTRVRLWDEGNVHGSSFLLSLWFRRAWNGAVEPAYSIDVVNRAIPFAETPPLGIIRTSAHNGRLKLRFEFTRIEGEPFYTVSPREMTRAPWETISFEIDKISQSVGNGSV